MGKKEGVFIYYFSNGSIDERLFVNNLKHGPGYFMMERMINEKVNYNNGQIIEKNK